MGLQLGLAVLAMTDRYAAGALLGVAFLTLFVLTLILRRGFSVSEGYSSTATPFWRRLFSSYQKMQDEENM